jgi:hypothetical protein
MWKTPKAMAAKDSTVKYFILHSLPLMALLAALIFY